MDLLNLIIILNIFTLQEYSIKVQRGSVKNDYWSVSRRYNEFASLNATLQVENFPPKKIIGNMHPEFIAKRRNALQVNTSIYNILHVQKYFNTR